MRGGIGSHYINSLCSGGFVDTTEDMCWFGGCWGHGTDVSQTGCVRLGSTTRLVSFYESLVGGGLRLSGSSSGRNGVFGYIEGSFLVTGGCGVDVDRSTVGGVGRGSSGRWL
jgi:hypothetical protein